MARALPTALRTTNFFFFFLIWDRRTSPGGFQGSLLVTQPRALARKAIAAGRRKEFPPPPPPASHRRRAGDRGVGNNGRDLTELLSGESCANINQCPPPALGNSAGSSEAAGGSASREGSPEAKDVFLFPGERGRGREGAGEGQRSE